MPRTNARRFGLFLGTPILAVSGRLFRFYGIAIGRWGLGVVTLPTDQEMP